MSELYKPKKRCFECGATEDLQAHHVVPKSRGGVKTLLFCSKCHGKIHNEDLTSISYLTKRGLAEAKRRGVKLGNRKNLAQAREKAVAKLKEKRESFALFGIKRTPVF